MARLILFVILTLAACSDSTGPVLTNGEYRAAIYTQPLSSGDIPGWAADSTIIVFRKQGGSYHVVSSSKSAVAIAEARYVQNVDDITNVHFGLRPDAFTGAEHEYFFIRLRGITCEQGAARSNNRNRTYFGTCTVTRT